MASSGSPSCHSSTLVGLLFGGAKSSFLLLCQMYARLDPWVVPVYVLLFVLAPLAVTDVGWWQTLASHGKTATTDSTSRTTTTTTTSDAGGWISNFGRALVRRDGFFWVPKRWFGHFYGTGLMCFALRCFLDYYSDPCRTDDDINDPAAGPQCTPPFFVERWAGSQTTLGILVVAHLIRRLVECRTVHVWHHAAKAKDTKSKSSESRLHAAGYLLGMLHYTLLPLALWPVMPSTSSAFSSDMVTPTNTPSFSLDRSLLSCFALGLFAVLNVWAQYQQHRHHVLLARLRPQHVPEAPPPTSSVVGQQSSSGDDQTSSSSLSLYVLPHGGWFHYVSCPHYLAEILVYATWAGMKDVSTATSASIGRDDLQEQVSRGPLFRHWILFVWVATNLTVSALLTHAWYLRHFRDDDHHHVLRKRYAIFPGWL